MHGKKTSCDTQTINCSDSDPTCLLKLQRYNQKQQIGSYTKKHTSYQQVSTYTKTTCSNYNYVIINNKTYTVSTSYTSSVTSSNGWKKVGRYSYENPPRDTETTRYLFDGADYSYCNATCESTPNFYYYKYIYTGSMSQVSSTTSVPSGSSTSVSASCGSYVTTTVPVYGYVVVEHTSDPLYGTVCYKSTKTRSNNPQTKWSSYNDTSLLNDGWTYTGNKKLAN